jgi:hypothetical protein
MNPAKLAADLTPRAIELLHQSAPEILSNSHGLFERAAIKHAIPIIETNMTTLIRDAIVLVMEHFGKMTLEDILKTLGDTPKFGN